MFCSNCGEEVKSKFCSECGMAIDVEMTKIEPINETDNTSLTIINGHSIDFNNIISTYGNDKIKAIKYLREITGLGLREAKDAVDNAYAEANPKNTKLSFWENAKLQAEQQQQLKIKQDHEALERAKQLDKEGIAYCPKCKSTSLSANKKGFGIGKAVVGAVLGGGIGLVAGNIGAKKIRITCLKCGHQFWAGK